MLETRPWGYFVVLEDRETHKLKRIVVNPSGALSYQSHSKRMEVWTIISGEGTFILDGIPQIVTAGMICRIPRGSKHRMINKSDVPLEFIEVQLGEYFGEDDIVRYQDEYNRV